MRQFVTVPLCALILAINLRINPGEREVLRHLGESCHKRLIHPLIIGTDKVVHDGTRRVLGLRLVLGENSDHPVECLMTDEKLTPADIVEVNFVTALHRADLSGYEKFLGAVTLIEMHAEWSAPNKDLASHLNLDPGMITRLLSPSKLSDAWKAALQTGKVGINDCYAASKVSEEKAAEMLAAKLNGSSAKELEDMARKARNGDKPAVRVNRLVCALPNGYVVTLTGDGLSLEDSSRILFELAKDMKKASADGLDSKTYVAVCRDRASKGGHP